MGLYSGGIIIRRIFVSVIWGGGGRRTFGWVIFVGGGGAVVRV